jgi:transposase
VKARRQARRRFSLEFKREAVKLFRDNDKGISQIARELGVTPVMLRSWVDLVEAEEKTGLSPDELEELKRLRKEVARLKEENEILGKATAFFAARKL